MWWQLLLLAAFTTAIIAAARWLLYDPAQRIVTHTGLGHRGAGQLLGFLTSVPELVTAIAVAATGFIATVGYNVLSSNIINIFLALAASTWFHQNRKLLARQHWREWTIVGLSIALPTALLTTGTLQSGWIIWPLLALLAGYLWWMKASNPNPTPTPQTPTPTPTPHTHTHTHTTQRSLAATLSINITLIAAGLIILYFAGDGVGQAVSTLGTTFGVPEAILGILIGIATSLPEATTFFSSLAAHRKANSSAGAEEVLHNVLASNVSNTLLVLAAGTATFVLLT